VQKPLKEFVSVHDQEEPLRMAGSGSLSRWLASSRFARAAALPVRVRDVARYDAQVVAASVRWLASSKEHTNYTYDLTDGNMEYLAWWVSCVAGKPVADCHRWMSEIIEDEDLRAHLAERTRASSRRGIADPAVRLGRRVGWYALIRALQPSLVVETGTDKGLGSITMAAALLRNGKGRLTTIDINPESGYLVSGRYAEVVTLVRGDSISAIRQMDEPVDMFLHDSNHDAGYEAAELRSIEARLAPNAVVLSDNAEVTTELAQWAERNGRRFLFFAEEPRDHWFPGGGIGAAW
jgi:predicted O-methyltransferase YrrM